MIRPADIFTDRAVLQQRMPIPVWGECDTERLVISYAGNSVTAEVADGKFFGVLPPVQAGVRGKLVFCAGEETCTCHDVAVGEVWVAGGQSNMEHPLFCTRYDPSVLTEDEDLRFFTVPRRTQPGVERWGWHFEGLRAVDTPWTVCTAESALHFSAIAYAFGRRLRQRLHVPVGIISCNWGGTVIETWISEKYLSLDPLTRRFGEEWNRRLAGQDMASYLAHEQAVQEELGAYIAERGDTAAEAARNGADVFLRTPNPTVWPSEGPYHPNAPSILRREMVGRITPYAIRGVLWHQGESNARRADEDSRDWYLRLLHALAADWREAFRNPELPFYLVQISTYDGGAGSGENWCRVREAQERFAEEDENAYMTVSVDLGEPDNIHPARKWEMGERLAAAALDRTYGIPTPWEGPKLLSAVREEKGFTLRFDHPLGLCDGALEAGDFFYRLADGKRFPAPAHLQEGDVVLSLPPDAEQVTGIGYVLANYSRATLVCRETGLPLAPFTCRLRS